MATGPTEPFGSEETGRESRPPRSKPVSEEGLGLELDPAQLAFSPRREPWRVRHLMYLVAIVAGVLWVGIILAGSLMIVRLLMIGGAALLFAAAMGAFFIVARRRSTRQDSLLSVLAIAAEKEMPLAPAVVAFADQYRGRSYRRVMDLAAQLNWGNMLPEALERASKVVTRDAVLLAWVGQAAGMLPKALRIAAAARSSYLPLWTAIAGRLAYILGLLLTMQVIAGFVMYYIIPKFEAIFKDFGVSLPRITILLIEVSHFTVRYGAVALVPLIEFALLIALPFSFLTWGNYNVPLFDRLLGRRHTAQVLRSLALVVDGEKPISLGISTLANHYPAFWIRRRLIGVESDVRHGVDWIQALWRHGLIRAADAEVLASAAAVGNLGWALSELAETTERRLATRVQAMVQTLFPLVVVMLGMMVFFMAVAYFLPLVQLIKRLTEI
ncbi:MAG: type II secretion system F family protein [Isosphaerales bacterium]